MSWVLGVAFIVWTSVAIGFVCGYLVGRAR